MTLPAAAPIKASDINVELGRSAGAAFDINGASERALAGVASGPISFSNFLGKASLLVEKTDERTVQTGSPKVFTACSYGNPAGRSGILILAWHGDTTTNPGANPTCTVSGVNATRIVADSTGDGASDAIGCAIFSSTVTDTSGDVRITWGNSPLPVSIVVLRVVGYTVTSANTETDSGPGSDGQIGAGLTSSHSLIVAIAGSGQSLSTLTWAGLTQQGQQSGVNYGGTNNVRTWAWKLDMTSPLSPSPKVTPWSAAQGSNCIVGAAFAKLP
jgi:hypothetical protein